MESWYMVDHNFTIKFPPDFHYYTGLNGLVNSFYYFTIALPNKLILGCKPHSSAKMNKSKKQKQHHARNGCLEVFYKKSFPKNYVIFTEKVC